MSHIDNQGGIAMSVVPGTIFILKRLSAKLDDTV